MKNKIVSALGLALVLGALFINDTEAANCACAENCSCCKSCNCK